MVQQNYFQICIQQNVRSLSKIVLSVEELLKEYLKNILKPRNSVFRRSTAKKCPGRNSHSEPGEDKDQPDRKIVPSAEDRTRSLSRRDHAREIRSAPISAKAIRDWINRGYEPSVAMNSVFSLESRLDRTFVLTPGEKRDGC